MSLLDIFGLDGQGGGNGPSPFKTPKPKFGGYSLPSPAGGVAPATSSQQRGAPERLDVNQFVSGINFGEQRQQTLGDQAAQGGTQLLEAAGKAPGFTFERPLAVADTIAQQATGQSPLAGIEQFIGQVPVLGSLLGSAGEGLQRLSALPAAIANSSLAESLKRGTVEGWSDNQMVQSGVAHAGISFGPITLVNADNADAMTWGQFKANAYAKGWKDADIQDLIDGKTSSFDYGNKRMSADNLTEMALRIGSDPTNLLFGAGAALKLGRGVGLLSSAVARGAELEKPLAPALAAEALTKGIAQQSTWMGLASHFGDIGRGIGSIPGGADFVSGAAKVGSYAGKLGKAYRNVAIGTTAAQLGIGAADRVLHNDANTPVFGPLEDLFQLNRKAFDNQPFSNNIAFSLWSAFHFPIHEYIGDVKAKMNAGKVKALGDATYAETVKALGEGWGAAGKQATEAEVLDRAGGADNIWNQIGHTHARIIFDKVATNPVVKDAISSYRSLDEAVLANSTLAGWVNDRLKEAYQKGEITAKQTVQQMKDWFAIREESGNRLNAVDFPWHGGDAIDNWHSYGAAVMPVNLIYGERGNVILGLRDNPIDLHLEHIGAALKTPVLPDGSMPLAEVRKWLSKYPQLINEDPHWNQYLLPNHAPMLTKVEVGQVIGKLKRAQKAASSARELTNEAGTAETAAARETVANPVDQQELYSRAVNGGATVGVSRLRPQVARKLGITPGDLSGVQRARLDPHIATFEEELPRVWDEYGMNYDHITQTTISDVQGLAPAVEIAADKTRLPELRKQAALLGEMGQHEQTHLTVSGERLRELGLNPNGWEATLQIPSTEDAMLQKVVDAANREFPGAFTFNDATGTLSIRSAARPDLEALGRLSAALEGYFPKDRIGDTGMRVGLNRAYTEFFSRKKAPDVRTYGEVLKDARRAGDPRFRSVRAVRDRLAYRRPTGGDGAAGLGFQPELGRPAGAVAGSAGNQSVGAAAQGLTPADRIGTGGAPYDQKPGDENYLYHMTYPSNAAQIAEQGIVPQSPRDLWTGQPMMAWMGDEGRGKRAYFNPAEQAFGEVGSAYHEDGRWVTFRAPKDRFSNIKSPASSTSPGEVFTTKPIGSQHLEVWGADGQWHPARGFFQPEVEPHIQALADQAAPAWQNRVASETVSSPPDTTGLEPGKLTYIKELRASVGDAGVQRLMQEHPERFSRGSTGLKAFNAKDVRHVKEMVSNAVPFPGDEGNPDRGDWAMYYKEPGPRPDVWPPVQPPDALTLGLRAQEDAAAVHLGGHDETVALSKVAQAGDETAIEAQRLAADHTARGAVLANAKLDAEASRYFPTGKMFSDDKAAQQAEIQFLDRTLQDHWPQYQPKHAPDLNVFADVTTGASKMAAEYLKRRTVLGDALANWGPTSRLSRFVDALTSPVTNKSLGLAADQALMENLMPFGATPSQTREFIKELKQETAAQTFGPTHVHLFRNPTSLGQQVINKIAAGDVTGTSRFKTGVFSPETIAAIGRDNFARILDRSSNRFIRAMDHEVYKGGQRGQLARMIGNVYGKFQKTPAGDATRMVSKTFYHVFRFMSDPRWWAMNTVEQDLLGMTGYGAKASRLTGAAKAPVGQAAMEHQFRGAASTSEADFEKALQADNGWMYTRNFGGFVSRSTDVAFPQDTMKIVREYQRQDPIFQGIVKMAGENPDRDIAQQLGKMLYEWDTKGAKATLQDEFQTLTKDIADRARADAEVKMMPLFQKMWERHDQTYRDIVKTFAGNADRSTLERIANSYWLFWPISYQLKAGKALITAMSKRFMGAETNLAGAALYAHYFEEHKAAMANDPSYAQMFKDNPTSWFLAQMMFTITPGDMGVSLSRIPRYIGGELGLWGKYAAAKDPFSAASAVLTLGPAYTASLMARLGREYTGRPTSAPAPTAPFYGGQ